MLPSGRYATFVVWSLAPSLAFAGPLPDRFTLGRYIPGDVWFYVHSVHNPERVWLDAEWAEVWQALRKSGIDRDIMFLVASALSGEDHVQAEATLQKWTALLKKVRWGDICAREFAFAERLAKGSVGPEYIALMRGRPDTAKSNMAGLVSIFKELESLSEDILLSERELGEVHMWSIGPRRPKSPELFPGFHIFRKGDIIGIGLSFGSEPFSDVIRLMTGKTDGSAVVAAPRFKKALTQVKAPEDTVMFFDSKQLFQDIDQLMLFAVGGSEPGCCDEDDFKRAGLIRNILELCNLSEYSIVSMETVGRRELTHTVLRIQEGKQKCALACALFQRRPFERFDEFIPADASSFNLNGLVDLEHVYKLVIDFVERHVPDGAEYVGELNDLLASIGFDPQRDLFSWWSGEMISVKLPSAAAVPIGNSDWVFMFRVKDGELASQKIDAGIDFIKGKLQATGQPLMISPVPVKAEGFRQVTHPFIMVFVRPVVGVKDEWLFIGSSPAAINKCLDVAAGRSPSIRENQRFLKEGLVPKSPVSAVSFKDMSRMGEEMSELVGMVAVGMGLATASIPDTPKTRDIKMVFQKLSPIVMKLGPVVQKIDFLSSQSSVTTFDGPLIMRTEKVVTYRPPSRKETRTATTK
ncbi:MAG: hypothetical protein JSU86_14755 [Phycisphaerales bacterium]|nr:MAG: hypothetical protein JSU86_14755 [Phycisphaerales bacterium]